MPTSAPRWKRRLRPADLPRTRAEQARLLSRAQAAVRQLELELAVRRRRAATLEVTLASQTTALADAREARAGLEQERAALRRELAEHQSELAARARETVALLTRTAGAEAHVRQLEHEAAARAAVIDALRAQAEGLASLQGRFAQLEADAQQLRAEAEAKEQELQTARQGLQESIATVRAAQRLSGTLEWKSTLERVLAAASERISFERGTLLLLDELQTELKVEAALNSPIAVSLMSRFKVGEGLAGRVAGDRQPQLIVDTGQDPRFKVSDPTHQPRSMVLVPLLAGDEVLGVLSLVRAASRPFAATDLHVAEEVAAEAARALNNARLYHVLKEREGRLEALVQRAWDLSASLEPRQVMASIVRGAQQLVDSRAALLALMDTTTYQLDVVAADHIPPEVAMGAGTTWGAPVARDVVRTGRPWLAPMSEVVPPEQRRVAEQLGMHYLVSIPVRSSTEILPSLDGQLLSRDKKAGETSPEVYGVLNLYREQTTPLPADLVNALLAFGHQAARALKNVKRWERLNDQMETTQSLNVHLLGRERVIAQLQFRVDQLERELARWRS
jgi:GAF domain-containing protein